MINKEKSKVLFASDDSDFADILLSFLTLPLGRILQLLESHYGNQAPTVGSLTSLRAGLQNLDNVYFDTTAGKLMLLNPASSYDDKLCELKHNICGAQPTKLFLCDCYRRNRPLYAPKNKFMLMATLYPGTLCHCGKLINTEIKREIVSDRVLTNKLVSFSISDHLRVVPNVTGSFLQDLKSLGITDLHGARLDTVNVGFDEMMDVLKGLLVSRTSLTDTFLRNGHVHKSATMNSELLSSWELKKGETCGSFKKMNIKAMIQKSSNRFLFAKAANDFVEFMFTLLTIPLGQVESLLNGNSGLESLDSLYRSVEDFDAEKCLLYSKDALLKPNLPHKYLSSNQIFSLAEQGKPDVYIYFGERDPEFISLNCTHWSFTDPGKSGHQVSFVDLDPKGQHGNYVKRNTMSMVTGDLTVTPFSIHSSVSTLKTLDVPLTDIEELEINIGLEEALSILRASLTSSCAITNGLKLNTRKQPNKEQNSFI